MYFVDCNIYFSSIFDARNIVKTPNYLYLENAILSCQPLEM